MSVWSDEGLLGDLPDPGGAWRAGGRVLLFDARTDLGDPAGVPTAELGSLGADDLALGVVDDVAWFARRVDDLDRATSPRKLTLEPAARQLVTRAQALFAWHATTPHCDRCGAVTVPRSGGRTRVCPDCGTEAFPRTDPAVIVSVLDPDDRLLLARQGVWEEGRVSVLAGFVEAGESAEQACFREIFEESGVRLSSVRFYGSQPWPYPRSLMLAFVARTDCTEVRVDGVELVWGRFFTRNEVRAAVADGSLILPGSTSVASRMVADWLAHCL